MNHDINLEQVNFPAASSEPAHTAADSNPVNAAHTAPPVVPPAAEPQGEAPPLIGPNGQYSLLKGARLKEKSEAFVLGTAGLTSNASRAAMDKLITAVVPKIAKTVMRALVRKLR